MNDVKKTKVINADVDNNKSNYQTVVDLNREIAKSIIKVIEQTVDMGLISSGQYQLTAVFKMLKIRHKFAVMIENSKRNALDNFKVSRGDNKSSDFVRNQEGNEVVGNQLEQAENAYENAKFELFNIMAQLEIVEKGLRDIFDIDPESIQLFKAKSATDSGKVKSAYKDFAKQQRANIDKQLVLI